MISIIGAGNMAREYTKVLNSLGEDFVVVGRGEESAAQFEKDMGIPVIRGGVEKYCDEGGCTDYAVVAVNPLVLADATNCLLAHGVKHLLVEKPGGMTHSEIADLAKKAKEYNAAVYVAYNRRFYTSTIHAREMIEADGGATSFNFEFTEWAHVIRGYSFPKQELEGWLMANSTHVIDLAFYLGGLPESICCYMDGEIDWHPVASRYSGAGKTKDGVLFSYKANWASAGRWSVEVLTDKRKYLLEPLETLKIQEKGFVKIDPYEIDDEIDKKYKPGLYLQTKAFLENDRKSLIDIEKHARMSNIYEAIETNGYYCSKDDWETYEKTKLR